MWSKNYYILLKVSYTLATKLAKHYLEIIKLKKIVARQEIVINKQTALLNVFQKVIAELGKTPETEEKTDD